MEQNEDSVFSLITSLCETFSINKDKIKRHRSNCYELLLKKRSFKDPRKFKDLKDSTDPMLDMLAWCYTLTHEYNLKEQALELQQCTEKLKSCYKDDNSFNNVLRFMLCLRNIPKKNGKKLDLSTLPEIDDQIPNFENLFKLPPIQETGLFGSFKLTEKQYKHESRISSDLFKKSSINPDEIIKDEGYFSPQKENIWEIASKLNYSKRRSWESYGCGPPDKEKPFLSELGEMSSLWVENLESLYLANNLFPSFTIINNKMKPKKIFIRDIKYLLVGMPSETFNLSIQEEFFISPGIIVEGITPDAIERYCSYFLFSGTCYRALNKMVTPDFSTRNHKNSGYVFTEFCESISRYLQFYRTAVMSIPDSTNFLTFHEKTGQIEMQISILASICKVGPYASESEEMPHGVALLNYLYQKVLDLSDKNISMVLYSILYPCCQVYFSRFLHQWLLKGSVNDPHGEFFVTPNLKYLSTRGRTYWTRSYHIREDMVPDFLVDLKDSILFCGRMMNLLHLCSPMNKLCMYLMGKKPLILSCCLTHDQLYQLEQNCAKYFLEACAACGSKFSFSYILEQSLENDVYYMTLIAQKRAATIRRIELERQKEAQEQHEKKLEELLMLKEQYEAAIEQKQINIYKEIEKEINAIQENLKIEQMREKLIGEEAHKMIDYYSHLCETAENQKKKIEQYIKSVKNIHIDMSPTEKHPLRMSESNKHVEGDSSNAVSDDPETIKSMPTQLEVTEEEIKPMHSSKSLDFINANVVKEQQGEQNVKDISKEVEKDCNSKDMNDPVRINMQQTIDNFEMARRIKQKVLNQELGIKIGDWCPKTETKPREPVTLANLTQAQRNKLKVLSSEFGIDVIKEDVRTDRVLTVAQINKNRVLGHDECFTGNYEPFKLDNENFVNRNFRNLLSNNIVTPDVKSSTTSMRKSKSLLLDFDKPCTKPHDTDKPIPMSVDSTPLSDHPQSATPLSDFPPRSNTPSSMAISLDTKMDSFPNTADTQMTDEGFYFPGISKVGAGCYNQKQDGYRPISTFSKRVTMEEAKGISKNCLKLFLHESVSIPLLTQLKLANNEILKYFVQELNYLRHLESLKDYFFLQDGEFGRNITENLFEKLYSANFPLELINCRTLQHLVFGALDNSSKYQENSKYLSFKINSLPKCFDLGDPDVLDCLSLTYKVNWPLNILLPSDTVSKYDQVFKFLIKLNRVSWVLKKIFLELKVLAKETGKKEIYLMSSPQYRRLHQCRHVMTHFMQTLQNYIVGDVLQPSWELFERSLLNVTNLDELYAAQTAYIKSILFRCMLNQKSTALKTTIQKIFVIILKFYDYLRSKKWKCEEGTYIHPNFHKLDKIFKNFEEFVVYLFKLARKVAKSGYQPYLVQFLDVLNVNDYYSTKLLKTAS